MRIRSLVKLLLVLLILAGAGYLLRARIGPWLSIPQKIALQSRLESQWRALDATKRSLTGYDTLADWSGAVFLGRGPMTTVLEQLNGYRLEFVGDDARLKGTSIEVKSVTFVPAIGYGEAQLTLEAAKNDVSLEVRLLARVSVQRISPSDSGIADMVVRLDPLELEPAVTWRNTRLDFARRWSQIVPDLAIAIARPDLFDVRVPVADTMRLRLGFDHAGARVSAQRGKAPSLVCRQWRDGHYRRRSGDRV